MALNRCEFIGNLGRDPEIRSTQSGQKWTASGEKKERTEWVRAVAWSTSKGDGLAGVIEKYLTKGSKVFIAGKMQTRKWTDQSGTEKYSTEIILDQMEMLDGKPRDGQLAQSGGWDSPEDLDDQIPF